MEFLPLSFFSIAEHIPPNRTAHGERVNVS
jgi:hypothetical protein